MADVAGVARWRRTPRQDRPVKRIWAQDVEAEASVLLHRLTALEVAGELEPRELEIVAGASDRLRKALKATTKQDPVPGRVSNWWRGTLVEASFQNLHAAEALATGAYPAETVWAEVPEAVARVEAALGRDDPRRSAALAMLADRDALLADNVSPQLLRAWREQLRKTMEVGFDGVDLEHTRLRNFRNAVLLGGIVLVLLLVLFIGFVIWFPRDVSFCFHPEPGATVCPTGTASDWHDVVVVALLGMLGGLLSAIVSIKNMRGTSIAYDVPKALAFLKLPLGALSAIGGLLVIRGEFIPGLSALDTSDQILAYAFALGVAQQLLVGAIDRQAQDLLGAAPSKATAASHPERATST